VVEVTLENNMAEMIYQQRRMEQEGVRTDARQLRSGRVLEDNRAISPATTQLIPNASMQLGAGNTGLPDNLKSGIEHLSGMSMDHVRVHYNSSQPMQLNALAYAQGGDIHVAPGQEKHLPHEAWHVVQQAQGRVKPTMQAKGVAINDNQGLEAEADLMGAKAMRIRQLVKQDNIEKMAASTPFSSFLLPDTTVQMKAKVIIDSTGLKVDRDGDLKYIDENLPKLGDVYRHMSPKDHRLKLAESFFRELHADKPEFQASQAALGTLQNQLTGYEYFTEHLGKQFMGAAAENKKLTGGQYDSLILAAQNKGVEITPEIIDTELNALAEDYMYIYLSRHGTSAQAFMKAVQHGGQMTLDAMWIFRSMTSQIVETAAKLDVNPNEVLELMKQRVTPQMAQKAMGAVAGAAEKAFLKNEWIGPVTSKGEPHGTYYKK
jgi:hypothetical protein